MEDFHATLWPVEMLERILHFLALEGASTTFHQLAYLTHRNKKLSERARTMKRPMVFRIGFDQDEPKKIFTLPVIRAKIVRLEIDWGDRTPIQIVLERGFPSLSHEYRDPGIYTVRVFPHGPGVDGVWLDQLGWDSRSGKSLFDRRTESWWRPLRSMDSLGSLGIVSLEALFAHASTFNLPLNHLDISNVTNMSWLFVKATAFNQPIGRWNTSNVTNMSHMFYEARSFNQNINRWNVSRVEKMDEMFRSSASFNEPIGDWDTSAARNMHGMFEGASNFNQDISRWDVANVTDLESMFHRALSFNQPIGCWNVGKIRKLDFLFCSAKSFNQPIGDWDVSSVYSMEYTFCDAVAFNQDLSRWNVSKVISKLRFLERVVGFNPAFMPKWK